MCWRTRGPHSFRELSPSGRGAGAAGLCLGRWGPALPVRRSSGLSCFPAEAMKELFWKKVGKALTLLHQPLKRGKLRSEGEQEVDSW